VRKSSFTSRSLEFLKFIPQPLAPPLSSSSTPPLPRSRPPPLTAAAALPAPPPALAAPTRRPQAGRRPSPSPLAFLRARHAAPPLPEHRPWPPRTPSAANSCYCSSCPLLVLKHAPGCSSTSSIPSRARCCLLLSSARLLSPDLRRPTEPLRATVVSSPRPFSSHTITSSSFAVIP
jgi:hypothetical protein